MSASVYYFGGYKASWPDMKAWLASATSQKPSVFFLAYPYPDIGSSTGKDAVAAYKNSGDLAVVQRMIAGSTSDVIYLVGHSSGCAVANAVDAGLKDTSKVTLVALDGYAPGPAQLARPSTQVWSAKSVTGKSLHYQDMMDMADDRNKTAKVKIKANVYPAASSASTQMALHFSLVNVSSSDALVKHIPDGYKNCVSNLCWMV